MTVRSSPRQLLPILFSLLVLILGVLFLVLRANDGKFVYTLDDPYIHLALARRLSQGHYGINANEYSAPSSSILWPVLLAPLAQSAVGEYLPLVLCILASLGATALLLRGLGDRYQPWLLALGGLVLTNQLGLIFTGMEHSLQVFLAVAAAVGLVEVHKKGQVPPWLPVVLIVGPLIRYEDLAITLPTACYLWFRGYRRIAVVAVVIPVLGLIAFSAFLKSLGLGLLPSSVVAKSGAGTASSPIKDVLSNFKRNLLFRETFIQVYALLAILATLAMGALKLKAESRALALTAVAAGGLHLLIGRFGWAGRYEPYVVGFVCILGLLLAPDLLAAFKNRALAVGVVSLAASLIGLNSIKQNVLVIPGDSHGIYLQQYQMHRFALDQWQKPIAVNDLGWVSWQNDQYVLDLYGLGNYEALKLRSSEKNPEWMARLAGEHQVGVAMIYDDWFLKAPKGWVKVATLTRNGGENPHDNVAIYATDASVVQYLEAPLSKFAASLPKGATLTTKKALFPRVHAL